MLLPFSATHKQNQIQTETNYKYRAGSYSTEWQRQTHGQIHMGAHTHRKHKSPWLEHWGQLWCQCIIWGNRLSVGLPRCACPHCALRALCSEGPGPHRAHTHIGKNPFCSLNTQVWCQQELVAYSTLSPPFQSLTPQTEPGEDDWYPISPCNWSFFLRCPHNSRMKFKILKEKHVSFSVCQECLGFSFYTICQSLTPLSADCEDWKSVSLFVPDKHYRSSDTLREM